MPYNGSGGFTVPNTFSPNTVISSSQMNANFTDIANNGFANVVTKDGQQVITAQLKGLVSANPAWSFQGDLDTGFGSETANEAFVKAGGVKTLTITSTGGAITGTFTASGIVTAPTYALTGLTNAQVAANIGNGNPGFNFDATDFMDYNRTTNVWRVVVGSAEKLISTTTGMSVPGTLGVTGTTTLAALSATTGSFSSTMAVTGATTLTGQLTANNSAGIVGRNTAKAHGRVSAGVLQAGSFNIASITDNGLTHTVTFTNAMTDANYTVVVVPAGSGAISQVNTVRSRAAGSFEVGGSSFSSVNVDPSTYDFVVYHNV